MPAHDVTILKTLFGLFLVALFWSLYRQLGRQRFFFWWMWAWAAFGLSEALSLVVGWAPADRGTMQQTAVLVHVLAVYLRTPLMIYGAWCFARSDAGQPPLMRLGLALAAAAGVALFLLSFLVDPPAVRSMVYEAPMAASLAAAMLYSSAVFLRWWRATGSRAAIVTSLATGLDGTMDFIWALAGAAEVGDALSSAPVSLFNTAALSGVAWTGLEALAGLGMALGMVLLLVEEHQRAVASLEASDQRYRAFVQHSTEGIWRDEFDQPLPTSLPEDEQVAFMLEHSRVAETNEAMARMYGFPSAAAMVGLPLKHFLDPADPTNLEYLRRYIRSGYRMTDGETHEPGVSGEPKVFLNNLNGIVENGCLVRTWGTQRDITERKKVEQALEEQRTFLRQVIDLNPNFVFAKDREGRYTLVNQAVADFHGATVAEILGKTDADLFEAEDLVAEFGRADREVFETGRDAFVPELPSTDSRGRRRWVQTTKRLLRSAGGTRDLVLGVATDITERKQAEELQAAVYRIAQAAEQAADLDTLFWSVHGIVRGVMSARNFYIALYDRWRDELSFPYFVDERDAPPSPRIGGRGLSEYVRRTGRPLLCSGEVGRELERAGEVDLIGSDSQVWVGVPLVVEGERIGVMAAQDYRDPTVYGERELRVLEFVSSQVAQAIRRRRAEEALRRSETMSAMGSLVAGVAHEVRNPLFSMSATLDAFESRYGARTEYRQHLAALRAQLDRLTVLMRDLLEYGKPPAAQREPGDLNEVIAEAVGVCSALSGQRRVRIERRLPSRLPPVAMERMRLVQVFANLVENAVQHSAASTSVVIGTTTREAGERVWLETTVADSGPGFAQDDLSRVFEPFFTKRRGGTGLGLSIVQRIVEQHGGQVTAENRPEGGGLVRVRLPAIAA
jgi:PAS domain S-box-containing protein